MRPQPDGRGPSPICCQLWHAAQTMKRMKPEYWQLRIGEYLEAELRQEGESSKFPIPDEWWLTDAPVENYRPLVVKAGRRVARPPDFFYYNMLPFVSDRFKDIVEAGFDYSGEFHRASLQLKGGKQAEANPYWYFRLFTRVDAVDHERSEIEFFPGTSRPKVVWQPRLNTAALEGRHIFRLNKIEAIFVSEKLRSALESAGLHAFFSPAEEFRLGW